MNKCNKCGDKLKEKDYKKYGIKIIVAGIMLFFLLLIVSYGTILPPLTLIIFIIIGIGFLLKKDRYFYFCNRCKLKFPFTGGPPASRGE